MRFRRPDLLVAGVALAGCVLAFGLTFRFSATNAAAIMSGMGAEFFPRLVIAAIAILAVCIALGFGNPELAKPPPIPGIVWITMGILAGYVALLQVGGMWLTSFVFMVGMGRLWGEKSWLKLSIVSAVMLAAIWFVFVKFLKGNFPKGLIAALGG